MFANIYFVPILMVVIFIIVILLANFFFLNVMRKNLEEGEYMAIKKKANTATCIIIIILIMVNVLINARRVVINAVPQNVIDRSHIQQQQEDRDRAIRKEAEE